MGRYKRGVSQPSVPVCRKYPDFDNRVTPKEGMSFGEYPLFIKKQETS
jgi:hypothetical protein